MYRKNRTSVESLLSARRKSPALIREGRGRGFLIPDDDNPSIKKFNAGLALAMMRHMIPANASPVAVAAMAEAEEALQEAEAAEEADEADAEVALLMLRSASWMMPGSMESGARVCQPEPELN